MPAGLRDETTPLIGPPASITATSMAGKIVPAKEKNIERDRNLKFVDWTENAVALRNLGLLVITGVCVFQVKWERCGVFGGG